LIFAAAEGLGVRTWLEISADRRLGVAKYAMRRAVM